MAQSSLKEQLPFFKRVLLFKDLDDEKILKLIGIMTRKSMKAGDLIAREGAGDDSLFILIEGQVEISKSLLMPLWNDDSQPQEKSLVRLSEKDCAFFGEMALFEDKPERSASIRALKACSLAVIDKKTLLEILEEYPEIGSVIYKNIATVLTRRLVKANRDILKLTTAFSLALEGD
jgi:CRP/FNR family cyclic AMP-dependent transcriptional regulator